MKEKIILKSVHPEQYPDLTIECTVIPNEEVGEYVSSIPDESKFTAYKNGKVTARTGIPGERIKTTLKTFVDGKEYILSEEENEVKDRGEEGIDIVVTNISSNSKEQYVVKRKKFMATYIPGENGEYIPAYDPRELAQVDESVIITTAWGSEAVCLKGSYIVTYNASENDYNTIEQEAFNSTYTIEDNPAKKLTR